MDIMNILRNFKVFILLLSNKMTLLFFITIALLLILMGYLVHNSSTNSLFINIGAGILTSIIFYLIFVEYAFYKNNRRLVNTIYTRVHNLAHNVTAILNEFNKIMRVKSSTYDADNYNMTDAQIKQLCETIFFHDFIQLKFLNQPDTQLTAFQWMQRQYLAIENDLKEIFMSLNNYLDSELIIHLNEFYYNSNRVVFHGNFFLSIPNQHMGGFTPEMQFLNTWSQKLLRHNQKYYKI